MEVPEIYTAPVITLVTRQELQKVSMEKGEKSIRLWTRTYGDGQTNQIVEQYTDS
jgi:hypothetical protein